MANITFPRETKIRTAEGVSTYTGSFWTSRQRQGHRLHEISYRACFKPQLPRFFIERFSRPGDVVYDPFMGRGTTLLEAGLLGRIPAGCDINPVSHALARPRFRLPLLSDVVKKLDEIPWTAKRSLPRDLLVFYHRKTLNEILALRTTFLKKSKWGPLDPAEDWIRMVALNRLTGHSKGFFSVYTLPPNQAVSLRAQKRINLTRQQKPPRRNVPELILKKTRALLSGCSSGDCTRLRNVSQQAQFILGSSKKVPRILSETVSLVVTSPPFLNQVNYAADNWLRLWFLAEKEDMNGFIDERTLSGWTRAMEIVFQDIFRVLKPGGHVAFEVGEIRRGTLALEGPVMACGRKAGLKVLFVLINQQSFTKTSHCWGIGNNKAGTNTNRVVVFKKP